MNIFAGQEQRRRCVEQTCGHSRGTELLFVSSLLVGLHFIVIPDSLAFKLSAFQALHCILFFFLKVLKSSMVLGEQEKFIYSIST